jgi:hypothetical protein
MRDVKEILRVPLEDLSEGELMGLLDAVSDEVKKKYLPKSQSVPSVGQIRELFTRAFAPVPTVLKGPED